MPFSVMVKHECQKLPERPEIAKGTKVTKWPKKAQKLPKSAKKSVKKSEKLKRVPLSTKKCKIKCG